MRIIQLTPGAGMMYCGNCLRDNAFVRTLREAGHDASLLPLYLPLTLDEPDESADAPVFYGGVNVYLEQHSALWRWMPQWFKKLLNARALLRWAGKFAATTAPAKLGPMTLSMLRGQEGNQARELAPLADWLAEHAPDAVCYSNALLLGIHPELKQRLPARTVCFLAGEDAFLDALPEPFRSLCWGVLREHATTVDVLIAPSRYYADMMEERLELPADCIHVVPCGLNVADFAQATAPDVPVLGYFARMTPDKGVDVLVEAYIAYRRRNPSQQLRLMIGGSMTPADEEFVNDIQTRIAAAGYEADATFHPNVSREEKIRLLQSLTVFSVPTRQPEAFGLYLIEAFAAGVPVILPNHGAFTEIITQHGGGLLYDTTNPEALLLHLEQLLADQPLHNRLSSEARSAAQHFTASTMARNVLNILDV